jgi:hypothetical protein
MNVIAAVIDNLDADLTRIIGGGGSWGLGALVVNFEGFSVLLGPLQAFRVGVELTGSPEMIMLYMKHINARYHADRIETHPCLKIHFKRPRGEKRAQGSFDL